MTPESFDSSQDSLVHKDVELFVSRDWDGVLSADETRRLVDHIRRCPECSTRSKRFLHLLTRLGEFTDPGESEETE